MIKKIICWIWGHKITGDNVSWTKEHGVWQRHVEHIRLEICPRCGSNLA